MEDANPPTTITMEMIWPRLTTGEKKHIQGLIKKHGGEHYILNNWARIKFWMEYTRELGGLDADETMDFPPLP